MQYLGNGNGNPSDINNNGQITGSFFLPTSSFPQAHAVLITGDQIVDLTPGSQESSGNALNDRGDVTGEDTGRAFLYRNGTLTNSVRLTLSA